MLELHPDATIHDMRQHLVNAGYVVAYALVSPDRRTCLAATQASYDHAMRLANHYRAAGWQFDFIVAAIARERLQ